MYHRSPLSVFFMDQYAYWVLVLVLLAAPVVRSQGVSSMFTAFYNDESCESLANGSITTPPGWCSYVPSYDLYYIIGYYRMPPGLVSYDFYCLESGCNTPWQCTYHGNITW